MFWNERDLEKKLDEFQHYYNDKRAHYSLGRTTPIKKAGERTPNIISIDNYRWKSLANGLFQLPLAA